MVVTFDPPTTTGGTDPVSASCTPPSGSAFPIGSTIVTCIAIDAVRRIDSCSFSVSVALPPPRLGITTILAFGDSITEGEVPVAGEFGIRPRFVEPDHSYPADLTVLLAQRYTAQGASRVDAWCANDPPSPVTPGIRVINAGCLGEQAEATATIARLNDKITVYRPDLVLLLEGVNDLSNAASVPSAVEGVRTLSATARGRGVPVFVSTLLPAISGDVNGGAASLIAPFNARLVPVAIAAGARVVDLNADIAMDIGDWISPYDGLHPTEAGYQEMARVWAGYIQSTFELPLFSATTAHISSGSSLKRVIRAPHKR